MALERVSDLNISTTTAITTPTTTPNNNKGEEEGRATSMQRERKVTAGVAA